MVPVPPESPIVERGVGFFETLLVIGRRVSLFDPHLQRLRGGMAQLGLPAPDEALVRAESRRVIEARGAGESDEFALRWTWMAVGGALEAAESWRLEVSARPIPPATLQRRGGAHAVTLPVHLQRDTPGLKSTSYLGAVLGLRYAAAQGADEGLFVDPGGRYLEGTATGLLVWNEGALLLPAGPHLPSLTREAFRRHNAGSHEVSRRSEIGPLEKRMLVRGTILFGALTRATPLLSLDGQACSQPVEMLERIEDFNRALVASAAEL